MIFLVKNRIKISLLLFLSIFLFSGISFARADTLSDLTNGVSVFVQFVVQGLAGIRNGICDQVSSSPSQFESSFCNGFVPTPSALSVQASSSTSDDSSFLSILGALVPSAETNISDNSGDISVASTSDDTTTIQTIATTTQSVSLPTGLSGGTAQTGVALDASDIIYWTNIARADNGGLSALNENAILDKIAEIRVSDMFAKQYFSHYSPTGDNVSLEANANGYQYITIGENIALGNFGSSRDLVDAWMNSPDHRANILNTSYQEIGVAAEEGMYQGNEVWISSQVFGEPLSACPSPDASVKDEVSSDETQATDLTGQITSAKAQLASDSPDTSAYSTDATAYNNLANQYNALLASTKTLIAEYNQQVSAFNACIQ